MKDQTRHKFDAFISYHHDSNEHLARAIECSVETIGKKWHQLSAARVFLDTTSDDQRNSLWGKLCSGLDDANYFVYLACPKTLSRPLILKELCHWLTAGSCEDVGKFLIEQVKQERVQRLRIVLTAGDISWDSESDDFDWQHTNALPEKLLRGVFAERPPWDDFRWASGLSYSQLRDSERFYRESAKVASVVRDLDYEKLVAYDAHQTRFRIRLFAGLSLGFALAAIVASIVAWIALDQKTQLARTNLTLERSLAYAEASGLRPSFPNAAAIRLCDVLSEPADKSDPTFAKAKQLAIALLANSSGTPIAKIDEEYSEFKFFSEDKWLAAWGMRGATILNVDLPASKLKLNTPVRSVSVHGVDTLLIDPYDGDVTIVRLLSEQAVIEDSLAELPPRSDTPEWADAHAAGPRSDQIRKRAADRSESSIVADAVSPDGEIFATLSANLQLITWKFENAIPVIVDETNVDRIDMVRFYGKHYLRLGSGSLREHRKGVLGKTFPVPGGSDPEIAISPDRDCFVTVDQMHIGEDEFTNSSTATLWDLAYPNGDFQSRKLDKHSGAVLCAVFTEDGSSLFTGAEDKRLIRWDRHGWPIDVFHNHDAAIAEMGSRRSKLITVGRDGSIVAVPLNRSQYGHLPIGNNLGCFTTQGERSVLQFSPGGSFLFAADGPCEDANKRCGLRTVVGGATGKPLEGSSVKNVQSVAWCGHDQKAIILDRLGNGYLVDANEPSKSKLIPKFDQDSTLLFAELDGNHDRILTAEQSPSKLRVCWRDRLLNPAKILIDIDVTSSDESDSLAVFVRNGCLRVSDHFWDSSGSGTRLERRDKRVIAIEYGAASGSLDVHFGQEQRSDQRLYYDAAHIPELEEIVTLRVSESVPNKQAFGVEILWTDREGQSESWTSSTVEVSTKQPIDEFFNRPEFFIDLTANGRWAAVCPPYGNAALYYLDSERNVAHQVLKRSLFSASRIDTESTYFRGGGSVFSPDGQHALFGDENGNGILFRLETNGELHEVLRMPTGPAYPRKYSNAKPRVIFSEDGRWVFWLTEHLSFWDLESINVPDSQIVIDCLYDADIYHYITFPGNSDDRWEWFDSLTPSISRDGKFLALSWMGGWGLIPLDASDLVKMLKSSSVVD